MSSVLVLEPGNSMLRWTLLPLALFPVILAICINRHADLDITVGLSLMPLLAAGGFAVGHFGMHHFGTLARFDRDMQQITITGRWHGTNLHYSWPDVRAIQFCDAGVIKGEEGSYHVYQVNLVIGDGVISRVNLLNNGGAAQLRRIAQEIANFLDVPFYVGSQAT